MKLVLNSVPQKTNEITVMNMENNTLFIYDYIGSMKWNEEDTTVTTTSFLNELRNVSGDITVRINSKGGEVGNALAIYQLLSEHRGKVTCVVDGYAYSSASWILLAGTERLINTGGIVMVHNPHMYVEVSDEKSIENAMPQWRAHRDSINMIITERTGMKTDKVKDLMDATTFMNSKQAIENGFCTGMASQLANIPQQIQNSLPDALKKDVPKQNNYSELLRNSLLAKSKYFVN